MRFVLVADDIDSRSLIVRLCASCAGSVDGAQMQVDNLARGRNQPFYKVIVDSRDRNGRQLSYVAEENIDVDFVGDVHDSVQHSELGRYFKRRVSAPVCPNQLFEPNDITAALYPDDWLGERVAGAASGEVVSAAAPGGAGAGTAVSGAP